MFQKNVKIFSLTNRFHFQSTIWFKMSQNGGSEFFFFPRTLLKTPGSKLIIYNLLLRVFHLIFAKPLLKFNFLCFITSITLSLFEGKKAKWKRSQSFSVPFISYFSYLRLSSSFPRTFLV